MAIDFLIFGLLLVSFVINLLALGAFWITPALRTTANRFTVNLLIINLIGCLILAPTIFLTSSSFQKTITNSATTNDAAALTADDTIKFSLKPGKEQMTIRHNGKLVEQDGIILHNGSDINNGSSSSSTNLNEHETIETIYKCNSTICKELIIDKNDDAIVITEFEEPNNYYPSSSLSSVDELFSVAATFGMRCWSIDLAAALGALAVLLVVGDTWCAITDPLRYHSRISGLKSWIFIALTWLLGISFGVMSALREIDFESRTLWHKRSDFNNAYISLTSTNSIYDLVFSCLYFITIIFLPFAFVCGMYWRIFSEARKNGLRMRQNGSSPLLQSALNLTHNQTANALHYSNSLCAHRTSVSSSSSAGGVCGIGNGLQMQLDHRRNSPSTLRRDSAAKVLLPIISDDGNSDNADADSTTGHLVDVLEHEEEDEEQLSEQLPNVVAHHQRHKNILLTLQAASGEIKRNYSARQLPLLGTSSQDLNEQQQRLPGVRLVHSSPNLQKYSRDQTHMITDRSYSSNLLHQPEMQKYMLHSHQQQQLQLHHQQHYNKCQNHQLQMQHSAPAAVNNTSPKTLSYMSSLRHRLSNASSLFKYREESRAARISILVVIMFLVSYLPYGFLVLLQSRPPTAYFQHSSQLAIFMVLLANITSPFIFAYRNKRVRRGAKRLFGLEAVHYCQRQSSSSMRGSRYFQTHSGSAKAFASIRRNNSKLSTYSSNSCKYLSPQSSVVGTQANGGANSETNWTIRANNSYSAFLNFFKERSQSLDDEQIQAQVQQQKQQKKLNNIQEQQMCSVESNNLIKNIPMTNDVVINNKKMNLNRRSLFKRFFKTSKNLGACSQCGEGQEVEIEPVAV